MHLLQNFLPGKTFAPIVTRDFRPPKPDPAGVLHIAERWGLQDSGAGLIMVCSPVITPSTDYTFFDQDSLIKAKATYRSEIQ